ncbi:MAG: T9SS type A sorting domain-containing protein [Chitinophagaceae bacterium]|nr:T9SS type A sorting domain-containing protein [Chitinophagaceae bacterium]
MRLIVLLFCFTLFKQSSAQFSWQYTHTEQAPANANFTIIDQYADDLNQLYILYSVDPGKQLYFSKINPLGQVLWTNTLGVPAFPMVDVTRGRILVSGNRAYAYYMGQGSTAATIAVQYDTNGTFINHLNTSQINTIWVYDVMGLQALPGGSLICYYSYGNALTNNDTVYVRKFQNNGNMAWQLKYPVLRTGAFSPSFFDNTGRFYFTYTSDSLAGGVHYLNTFTRCVDTSGNIVWTNHQTGFVGRFIQPMYNNNDMVLCGPTNPNGGLNGNSTGDIVLSRINGATGQTTWTQTYDGTNSKRDEVYGMALDPMNNIYIAGAENIQDVVAAYNNAILLQYNASGQIGYNKKGNIPSVINGLFINPLQQLITLQVLSGQVKLTKHQASNGMGLDSLNYAVNYGIGKAASVSNSNADVFFTYSEAHCGANHVEALRFCSRAVCNPNAVEDLNENAPAYFYPNPAHKQLYFSSQEAVEDVILISPDGRQLRLNQEASHWTLPEHATGIYMLRYRSNHQWKEQRIVLE